MLEENIKNMQMNYRDAKYSDLKIIKELLQKSNLQSVDCEEHLNNFILIEDKGKIVGVGGLEIYDDVGLLRSIVVIPENRGNGIGKKIYLLIEERASSLGVNVLFLLTETAEKYFSNLGFSVKYRNEVPASIKGTKQFKELCSFSAKVMFREL